MKTKILLIDLLLLVASLACTLTGNLTPTPPPTTENAIPEGTAATSAPEATSTPREPTLAPDLTPDIEAPDIWIVCFANDYDGLVRVRECPGMDCREIATLPARTSLVVLESVSGETGTWAQITSPIQGWLNARYVCQP